MNIIESFKLNRLVRNATQQQGRPNDNGYNPETYTRHLDYNKLFFDGSNKAGRYDNFYGDFSKRVSVDSQYPLFYVKKNKRIYPKDGTFAYYLENPNDSYPHKKILQQVYSELLTKGSCDLFLWRKDGKNETRIFDVDKKYKEDDFRGFTLVSGYDRSRLTKLDRQNIVPITLGASQGNVFCGYSPSQAANSWVKMQDEMGLHMTAFARNAGMPIGKFIITAPSPEEYAKLKNGLDDKISGAKNNGKILYDYRPSESKVTQIEWVQFTSREVQDYTPSLEFAENKATQMFSVPGTLKGTNKGEVYASARVSEQVFIKYTVKPDVDDFTEQLEFAIKKRFNLAGDIKTNVVIPEIADESLVKIQATEKQVVLFDQKRSEGYTPESIVNAYNMPESFLLLEKEETTGTSQNTAKKKTPKNKLKSTHKHEDHDEFDRYYKNALTKKETKELESGFRVATEEFANKIFEGTNTEEVQEEYKGKMSSHFESQYTKLYDKSLNAVTDSLLDELDSIDVSTLELTPEELEEAKQAYAERVTAFTTTFTEGLESLIDKGVTAVEEGREYHVKRVVVTESEHTRIVSELKSWTKAQEEFPVRVNKTWRARSDACPECKDIDGTTLDVTALFINNPTNEIYEVQAGGLHPNCRCSVFYTMSSEEVQR